MELMNLYNDRKNIINKINEISINVWDNFDVFKSLVLKLIDISYKIDLNNLKEE